MLAIAMAVFLRSSQLLLLILVLLFSISALAQDATSSYIVYMGDKKPGFNDPDAILTSHLDILGLASNEAGVNFHHDSSSLLYSYRHAFNGFAAKLSTAQVEALSRLPEVLSVFPNSPRSLHTTRTWKFLGVESQDNPQTGVLWDLAGYGKDIIVGLLDTGIWPESESFTDAGYSAVPKRWKGSCVEGDQFGPQNCNKKLVGGKYYIKGYEAALGPINLTATPDFRSARDYEGHGTHTSSTAAGNFVSGANVLGFANGVAKGGAPKARIAMYKVCWAISPTSVSLESDTCYDADILAAFDEGIADGVDLFSLSVGGNVPIPPAFQDSISIGSFHAVTKGIPVVVSGGNAGPAVGTITNVTPWLFTVAASTLDRSFPSNVVLGNDKVYEGVSLSEDKLQQVQYPLALGSQVGAVGASPNQSTLCIAGSLDPVKVKGKIVACLRGVNARLEKGQVVKAAGGAGMILGNAPENGDEVLSDAHFLPATHITASSMQAVTAYITSTSSPTATLTPATTILDFKPAPVMASFSSQGPNSLFPEILKPDITAPGSNILAAWTNATGLTATDPRRVAYNVLSGTSMSCPHISGIVALLRDLYPRWSPAAIKSAIITTATQLDNTGQSIKNGSLVTASPYNYGGGHVDANAAVDPGLVYDTSVDDYIKFLCGQNYTSSQVAVISGTAVTCPMPSKFEARDLNYPSLSVAKLTGTVQVSRTVTNVGKKHGSYRVSIQPPQGVDVTISPSQIAFDKKYESQSFNVTLTAVSPVSGSSVFGSYTWPRVSCQNRYAEAVIGGSCQGVFLLEASGLDSGLIFHACTTCN